MDMTEQILGEMLGEASVLFMSNPLPGTEQVMPTRELQDIIRKTMIRLKARCSDKEKEYCQGEPCTCNPRVIKVEPK